MYVFVCVDIREALEEEEDLEQVLTRAFLNLDNALHRHIHRYGNSESHTHTHAPQLPWQQLDIHIYTHTHSRSVSLSLASHLTAGTTATVAMLREGVELVVGSVGDSRALLCRKGRAYKLTHDHTPDRKDERQRSATRLSLSLSHPGYVH